MGAGGLYFYELACASSMISILDQSVALLLRSISCRLQAQKFA